MNSLPISTTDLILSVPAAGGTSTPAGPTGQQSPSDSGRVAADRGEEPSRPPAEPDGPEQPKRPREAAEGNQPPAEPSAPGEAERNGKRQATGARTADGRRPPRARRKGRTVRARTKVGPVTPSDQPLAPKTPFSQIVAGLAQSAAGPADPLESPSGPEPKLPVLPAGLVPGALRLTQASGQARAVRAAAGGKARTEAKARTDGASVADGAARKAAAAPRAPVAAVLTAEPTAIAAPKLHVAPTEATPMAAAATQAATVATSPNTKQMKAEKPVTISSQKPRTTEGHASAANSSPATSGKRPAAETVGPKGDVGRAPAEPAAGVADGPPVSEVTSRPTPAAAATATLAGSHEASTGPTARPQAAEAQTELQTSTESPVISTQQPPTAAASAPAAAAAVPARQAQPAAQMLQDVEVIEVAAPQTTSVVSSAAATVEAEPRPQTPVIDQIAESLPDVGLRVGQQIVIRLNPPHLGRVRLTLQAEGREIRGVVHVDNPRTFQDLQRETTQLASRLAEGGVQLRRLDVQLSNPDRDGQTDSTLPQYQEGRQNAPQRDAPDREGDPDGGGRLEAAPAGGEEDPLPGRADDDSINVWI